MRIRYSFNAIENFLKSLNIEHRTTPDGEIAINSPFVGDTTFDCRISIDKQCYHDFESSEGGNIEELAAVLADVDEKEAKRMLLSFGLNNIVDYTYKKEPEIINTNVIEMPTNALTFSKNSKGSTLNFQLAKKFLVEKLVDYKRAKKYDLRWTEVSYLTTNENPLKRMNFSSRIIIPTYEDGKLTYFQARDYAGNSDMRYKNPPKTIQRKGIIVPFYDTIIPNEILFISEGPWEAIQYGGTYMLGPTLSDRQIYKIKKKNPKAIYLIPDNDETARRKLTKNITLLRSYMDCPIYITKWWGGDYSEFKDPIDAGITLDDLFSADFIKADRNVEIKIKIGMV